MKKHTSKNADTLLSRFIFDRVEQYKEPSRKGTPRGETIGFSRDKYIASLYTALTVVKLKDIAGGLKISHGLLRKWKTEDSFKAQMEEHCRGFAKSFVSNVHERLMKRKVLNEAYQSQSREQMAKKQLPSMSYKEISDVDVYSNGLLLAIYTVLAEEANKAIEANDVNMQAELLAMTEVVSKLRGEKKPDHRKKRDEFVYMRFRRSILEDAIALLSRSTLGEDELKSAIHALKIVHQSLEHLTRE